MSIQEEDRLRYENILREIRGRTDFATSLLQIANNSRPLGGRLGLPGVMQIESAAMHIRKILELIVFGSLVTNRREVEAVAKAFHKADVEDARKLARRVNSHYWPTPLAPYERVALPEIAQHRPLEGVEYLRETDWGRAYGESSAVLHAANPYAPTRDMETVLAALRTWTKKIIALLNHHQVTLVDRNYYLACVMRGKDTDDVQVAVFELLGPEEEVKAALRRGEQPRRKR
jgi:hypothetical protein